MSHLYSQATEYLESNLRLIPIHPISDTGKCSCDKPDCEDAGKHPIRTNWQLQRLVDSATVDDVWNAIYHCNGFGWALDPDHIVMDVDPRNDGTASLEQLMVDININLFDVCSAIVKTGGGGLHFYFRKEENAKLGWKMPKQYPGIDIKQAGGFVIIAGSSHVSGAEYEWHSAAKSDTDNLALLPPVIADMLSHAYAEHREHARSSGEGDVEEIRDMLTVLSPDMPYESWIKVGMAIHDGTNGSGAGFTVWDAWSRSSTKYKDGETGRKWHSFGKFNGESVKVGSLVKMAGENGWEPNQDSAFLSAEDLDALKKRWDEKKEQRGTVPSMSDDSDVDLYSPPGLLGQINKYVWQCSMFPNKNLTLACSLSVLTNVIGHRYHLPGSLASFRPNMIIFCIAGSSVGKDAIQNSMRRLLSSVGLGRAMHGRIRSEKDLLDAIEANQYAIFLYDEFGQYLKRLENAMQKGGATYLEGVIATIMEVFTKSDKMLMLDLTRRLANTERWATALNTAEKNVDDGKGKNEQQKADRAKLFLKLFEEGIPNPFVSMMATATPESMTTAFSGESTTSGFLSRALTFFEHETNPRKRPDFKGTVDIPSGLAMALKRIAFTSDDCPFRRIDSYDMDREELTIDADARIYLDRMEEYFYHYAEAQKQNSLESLPRRAQDSVYKICMAMAAECGRVTMEIVRYAVKLVRMEMDGKIRRVLATEGMKSKDVKEKAEGVSARILEICNTAQGETAPVIWSKIKTARLKKDAVGDLLKGLIESGYLVMIDSGLVFKGDPVLRYKTTKEGEAAL